MRLDIKKYAIEFAVIFISITFSFIAEEWRTDKQEMKVAKEYLQRLKTELNVKTLETKRYLDNNKRQIRACERVATNFKTREIKDDSLFVYIIESEGSSIFEPELAAWESLKSSGVFSSIKPEIIDSVNSLLQIYRKLERNSKYLDELFVLTWPEFLPDIPSTEVTDQWISFLQMSDFPLSLKQSKAVEQADMSKFLSNSVAVDYFFTKFLYANETEKYFKYLPEKEMRLIELIEKEIEE